MGTRIVGTLIALALIVIPSQFASGSVSPGAVALLQHVAIRLHLQNAVSGKSVCCCQGFVYGVRGESAYVVSAKHCAEHFALRSISSMTDYTGLVIRVLYANGTQGVMRRGWALRSSDVMVLETSYSAVPDNWRALCPRCGFYKSFGTNRRLPIVSTLIAGLGSPMVSAGTVTSDALGRFSVDLAVSPGTSGSVVLDSRGNVVGIAVAMLRSDPSIQASSGSLIVRGDIVAEAIRQALLTLNQQ